VSNGLRAVTPCSWGVKAGMVRVWVAGKTVCDPLVTHGSYLSDVRWCIMIKCYIKSRYIALLK